MLPRDKLLHIGLGFVWLFAAMVSYWVLVFVNVGAFLAYHTTVFGLLYEANQAIRKEGRPELLDAVATAAPGWLVWGILHLMGW